MDATVKPNAWLGVGFGSVMLDSDMIVFQGSGDKGNVMDMMAYGQSAPALDVQQDITWNSTVTPSSYSFTVFRELTTPDTSQDFSIPLDAWFDMIWAEQATTADY